MCRKNKSSRTRTSCQHRGSATQPRKEWGAFLDAFFIVTSEAPGFLDILKLTGRGYHTLFKQDIWWSATSRLQKPIQNRWRIGKGMSNPSASYPARTIDRFPIKTNRAQGNGKRVAEPEVLDPHQRVTGQGGPSK